MDSISTSATSGVTRAAASRRGDVRLPAATCAPATLVVAVDAPVSQETSAPMPVTTSTGQAAHPVPAPARTAGRSFAAASVRTAAARTAAVRTAAHEDLAGPASRGTPV